MSVTVIAVRALTSRVWHVPSSQPSGHGVYTLCGLGWPEDNYFASRVEEAGCKRCRASVAHRTGDVVVSPAGREQ